VNPNLFEPSSTAKTFKGRTGLDRIAHAAGYSRDGLMAAFRGEAAFRQLVLLNLALIPLAFLLDVNSAERALLILVTMLTLVVELLNSAIEATIDRISLDVHPLSAQAKDMGSAAQLLTLATGGLVWAVILL